MRKGLLGSIAALAAGAGAAWGQPPGEPAGSPAGTPGTLPGLVGPGPGNPVPQPPIGGPPRFGGLPSTAIPGNAGFAPAPAIMPPGNFGPPEDPLGIGPVGGFGPPPSPMYPMPGPYAQQSYQPSPPMGAGGGTGGYGGGEAPRWWFDGEYLLWFTSGQRVRYPLLTSSAPSDAGIVGAPSTTVLSGQNSLGYNAMNGLRLAMGFYGDADRRFGFEMSGFILERRSNIMSVGGPGEASGIPTLAIPYIDATTGAQNSLLLSGPNYGTGSVVVGTNSQTWSVEPVGIWNIYRSQPGARHNWSLDFLAGYQFIQMKEELWIQTRTQLDSDVAMAAFTSGPFGIITQLPAAVNPATANFGGVVVGGPAVVQIRDQFRTTNQFNGVVLGLRSQARFGIFTTSSYVKVGLGNMHERVEIFGGSAFTDFTGRSGVTSANQSIFNSATGGGAGAAVGGVLANSGNIGTYVHDRFTAIPQFGTNIGIALTSRLSGFVGVSAIYFPDVVRPGYLVNPVVSSASVPFSPGYGAAGAANNPNFAIREVDHWLGGVNFGLKLNY